MALSLQAKLKIQLRAGSYLDDLWAEAKTELACFRAELKEVLRDGKENDYYYDRGEAERIYEWEEAWARSAVKEAAVDVQNALRDRKAWTIAGGGVCHRAPPCPAYSRSPSVKTVEDGVQAAL